MIEDMSTERKILLPSGNNKCAKSSNPINNSRSGSASDFSNIVPFQSKAERSNANYNSSKSNHYKSDNWRYTKKNHLRNKDHDSGERSISNKEIENRNQSKLADVGSVFRPGSKKSAHANDLLNFHFGGGRNQRKAYSYYRKFTADDRLCTPAQKSAQACYNKEQFLLANCQFVVNDKFNYSAHLIDPDLLVDWGNIEEIRLSEPEPPSCPICLYPPVAAQITKCGHVFCYACILHYLSLSDKQWRKCPICYESVYKNQLRSVLTTKAKLYGTGEKITFRLMFREKGSNFVAPVLNSGLKKSSTFSRFEDNFARFSKLLLTTNQQTLISTIEREKVELKCQYAQEKDQPESCFILEALEAIGSRQQALESLPDVKANPDTENNVTRKDTTKAEYIETFIDTFNDISVMVPVENSIKEESKSTVEENAKNVENKPLAEKIYYFYQADDGQPIFMHPLNVHCLIMEYGSLARAPELITGTVVEVDTFTMCPDVRKHYRYLGHLPLASVFSLIEFKFDECDGQVSSETLECFKNEFEKRDRFRAKKLHHEKKQQERCQLWEKAVLHNASSFNGNNSTLSVDIPSSTFVQSAQSQIEASLTSLNDNLVENFDQNLPSTSGAQNEFSAASSLEEHGLSFAQMLKCGKPKLNPKNVADSMKNAGEEEYAPSALTSYRAEFGDAIKLALENLNKKNDEENANSGKKKKKKGKILFTL